MGVVLEVRVFPLIAAVTPMTVGLNIPAVGLSLVGNFQIGKNSTGHSLRLMVSSVCRQTTGASGTYHGLFNS